MKNVINRIILLLFMLIGSVSIAKSQSHQAIKAESNTKHSKHMLGVMFGYAWVPQTVSTEGDRDFIVIPSIGLDYGYSLGHHFGLVLVNDVELSSYVVQDADGSTFQRDNKYIGAITALYHITPVLGIFAGPGIEFEHNKSFAIVKIGFDLAKHFDEGWAFAFNASIDINNTYETISTGLVVSKYL